MVGMLVQGASSWFAHRYHAARWERSVLMRLIWQIKSGLVLLVLWRVKVNGLWLLVLELRPPEVLLLRFQFQNFQ